MAPSREILAACIALTTAVAAACGSSRLGGEGSGCAVTTDCQVGLVCLLPTGKCSSNLSALVPPSAGAGDASSPATPARDGAPEPSGTDADKELPEAQSDSGEGADDAPTSPFSDVSAPSDGSGQSVDASPSD